MTSPKLSKAEREQQKQDAIEYLRSILPAGSTVSLVLTNVSRSGMSRHIKCLATLNEAVETGILMTHETDKPTIHHYENTKIVDISWYVAKAGAGDALVESPTRAVRIGGCGMDMGLALIDSLSYAVYGKACPQLRNGGGEGINYKWL